MTFALGPALLFCPGDRPDRYVKAIERADAVILDLEDAVAAGDREMARAALLASPLDRERVVVRVNEAGSADFEADIAAVRAVGYRVVLVPKADRTLATPDGLDVIALCETAAGVLAAPEVAQKPGVVALMWGAEDLVASLGGTASRDSRGLYRDVVRQARSTILIAAGAAGIAAIDTVHVDIPDVNGLEAEAEDAAAVGFAATACIHPSQVPGTAVTKILPPVSRFAPDGGHGAKKQRVLERLGTFFERFFGLSSGNQD